MGGVEAREPALAQGLEAGPAALRAQDDAEEVAELLVEVGQMALGMREGADGEIGQPAEPVGEEAEGDGLAGAGLAGDEGEAAFADEALLDAGAKELDLRRHEQGFQRQLDGEGIPLEAIEGQEFLGHDRGSSGAGVRVGR